MSAMQESHTFHPAFDDEMKKLGALCRDISRIHLTLKGRESYMPLVNEYNSILNDLLDRGLCEPLDFEVEIAYDLISPRYLDMLTRTGVESFAQQLIAGTLSKKDAFMLMVLLTDHSPVYRVYAAIPEPMRPDFRAWLEDPHLEPVLHHPFEYGGCKTTDATEHVRAFRAFLARLDQAREG